MKLSLVYCFLFTAAASAAVATSALPGNGRLHRLPVAKFSFVAVDKIWIHQGHLDIRFLEPLFDGSGVAVDKPAEWPDEAYEQVVVALPDWEAYQRLGAETTANFILTGPVYTLQGRGYRAVRFDASIDALNGSATNLSMRARTGPGEAAATAGFVITGGPAGVLLRAVGPGLADKGIDDYLADPFLTLFQGGTGLRFNDQWSTHPDAAEIARIGAAVGAFPLEPGSRDAAILIELEPGAYTLRAEGIGQEEGVVLVEVYVVPGKLMPTS